MPVVMGTKDKCGIISQGSTGALHRQEAPVPGSPDTELMETSPFSDVLCIAEHFGFHKRVAWPGRDYEPPSVLGQGSVFGVSPVPQRCSLS